jgi:hypothetical protein
LFETTTPAFSEMEDVLSLQKALFLVLLALCITTAGVADGNYGEVQIYVFADDGEPLENVTVEAAGEVHRSDESGLLNFRHAPGKHEFALTYQDRPVATVTVPIRQSQATEVIVTVSRSGAGGSADVEAQDATETADRDREGLPTIDEDAPTGTIAGRITEIETGEPVANATIIFRGIDFEAATDENGRFVAPLPEGEYSISTIHADFSTQTRDQIVVVVGETTSVEMELTPSAIELEAVPVFAATEVRVQGGIANLIEETRNSGAVINLIGQEQIGRTGDSDAASALRRVTGLTVVDGRFVYVRGMGERYSSSLLNGARLPSPEIDKRVVPLDLFPTGVVESMAIQKSYSPSLPADFGGGIVEIRSIGIPDDRYKRRLRTIVNASVGYNVGATFTERLAQETGSLDFLGLDAGLRRLPEEIEETTEPIIEGQQIFGQTIGMTASEVEALGESFPVTWEPNPRTVPLDYSLSLSVRDKIELTAARSLGVTGSVLFSDSWNWASRNRRSYLPAGGGELTANTNYVSEVTSRDVDLGALLDVAYEHNRDFSVDSTTVLVRATDGTVDQYAGRYNDDDIDLQVTEQAWIEQTLLNQSLRGTAAVGANQATDIELQYTFSLADRYEPDHRFTSYWDPEVDNNFDESNKYLAPRSYSAQRWYTNVRDLVHDGRIQFSLPVFFLGNGAADYIDIGGYAMQQDRDARTRRFNYRYNKTLAADPVIGPILENDANDLIVPEHIGTDVANEEFLQFEETTESSDSYRGSHTIVAGYLNADALLLGNLRVNLGTRVEWSRQTVDTYDFFSGEALPTSSLETIDVLPAANLTLPLNPTMQIRLSGSRTLNRPDLRELSPTPKYGPPGTGSTRGNPDLRRALIYNADGRFEAYISELESFSIGGFYKYFVDPIETLQLNGAGYPTTFSNIPRAYNFGGEVEWALQLIPVSNLIRRIATRMHFDSLDRERRWRRLLGSVSGVFRDIRTTGNVSVISSQIDYAGQDRGDNTSQRRPLQGQSPYVVNASLGYKNSVSWSQMKKTYTSVYLNYNVFGPRISRIGTDTVDDFYELPFHQLDVVFKHQFNIYWSVGLKAKNVLDLPAEETIGIGGPTVRKHRKGRSFSLSVSMDL